VPFWQRPGLMVSAVIVVVLIAALLVWAPWIAPAAPTQLHGSSRTATSVTLQWSRSNGHTSPGRYSIVRDGATVGSVPGDRTSYLDEGLRPGQTYTYSVVAASWARHSAPAQDTKVRVLAPSPGKPAGGPATVNSLTVRWSPPADSPTPDRYDVLRDGMFRDTVERTSTVYKDTGLSPATAYTYQVVARWGENQSDPGPTLTLKTATPALSAARLTGSSWPVRFAITNVTRITNLNRGLTWTNFWDLTARCASGPCDVQVSGEITPPNFKTGTFNVRLTRHGAVYSGTTTAHLTQCGDIDVTDTVTFRVTVKSAGTEGKEWMVKSWSGTVRVDSPFTNAGGGFFCPGSRIDTNLAG
jgi:chitodextrinase